MKTKFLLRSEAARELRCSTATLKGLERRGLLKVSRTPTGVRIFSAQDVRELARQRSEGKVAAG